VKSNDESNSLQLGSTYTSAGVFLAGLTLATPASATDLEASHGDGHEHHHHIAVILGNTHTEHDEDAFTIGIDYEYRLSPLVGVGVLGEYATGGVDAWVVGVPFALHPGAGWRLVAMPGVEIHDGESAFLFRTGVGYEFELGEFTVMPEVNADFVDDETNLFFGASIGFKF
jgi:hypothetical protein